MFNIGLKLWSVNENYLDEAKKLYEQGLCQYIELYIIPNSLNKIDLWKNLHSEFKIPFIIHAPHFREGVNLASRECKPKNMALAKEAIEFADVLNSKYIIFHPGIAGDIKETVSQFNELNDDRILVENKPYYVIPGNFVCNGATIDEIKFVLDNTNVGFCLDIGHAICAANALKIEPMEYIKKFLEFKPKMFHLADNKIDSIYDKHFHFGQGDLPIKNILNLLPDKSLITVETFKDFKNSLEDFERDMEIIKNVCKGILR